MRTTVRTFFVSSIDWDLPTEALSVQNSFKVTTNELTPKDDPEDFLSDYISNETGFCHFGFNYEELKENA